MVSQIFHLLFFNQSWSGVIINLVCSSTCDLNSFQHVSFIKVANGTHAFRAAGKFYATGPHVATGGIGSKA